MQRREKLAHTCTHVSPLAFVRHDDDDDDLMNLSLTSSLCCHLRAPLLCTTMLNVLFFTLTANVYLTIINLVRKNQKEAILSCPHCVSKKNRQNNPKMVFARLSLVDRLQGNSQQGYKVLPNYLQRWLSHFCFSSRLIQIDHVKPIKKKPKTKSRIYHFRECDGLGHSSEPRAHCVSGPTQSLQHISRVQFNLLFFFHC